jgi:hypothetical protein
LCFNFQKPEVIQLPLPVASAQARALSIPAVPVATLSGWQLIENRAMRLPSSLLRANCAGTARQKSFNPRKLVVAQSIALHHKAPKKAPYESRFI